MDVVRPRGPLPASVYWRRRALVLGVPFLLVLIVVWWGMRGSDDQGTAPATQPVAEALSAPTTPAPTTPVGPQPCTALALALQPDAASYSGGAEPVLTVTVTNTADVACLVDVGDAQREIVITSGTDRIWSSRDCAGADTQSIRLLLDAGQADTRQVQWTRVRSVPGCTGDRPAARSGTYSAQLTLGGVSAQPAVFVLG